ncbi:MAG: hypothetical protein Q8L27_02700, partial [archaeon]|nr:hypothetical protein [archaeon]
KFDMQFIRYMNLFSRVTRVESKHCFAYNNGLVFIVPKNGVMQAIGRDNSNLKKLSGILGKRIRVVAQPAGEKELQRFIATIVSPVTFEKAEIIKNQESGDREIVISTGNRESKAMLIGRARAREAELKDILEQYFGVKILRMN